VLVTEGTSGPGAHVARWLAKSGVPRLILTGVSDDELIAELTGLGADVTTMDSLAVSDEVTAVVHTGPMPEPVSLAETTTETLARAVAAAVALDRLVGDRPLDAFLLFSSVAGVWGSQGQVAYAAEGAFLDAVAQRRRANGLAATSISWGPWAGFADDAQWERIGLGELAPSIATGLIGEVVGTGAATAVVADVDWSRFANALSAARPAPLLAELAGDAEPADDGERDRPRLARELAGLTPIDRERRLLDLVRGEVADALGYSGPGDIAPLRPLTELGVDSLAAVSLRNRLSAIAGTKLPATLAFDHPTAAAVAVFLGESLAVAPVESPTSVDAAFDRIASELSTADGQRRTASLARLRALLASTREDAARQLDLANDEDLFAFIDSPL
jgi:hypothetical protein